MKRLLSLFFMCLTLASCSMSMQQGDAWLASHKDPPALNVTGTWTCNEFSVVQLKQEGKDITGTFYAGGLIKGVSSGDSIHLLIYDTDTVIYMATLKKVDQNAFKGEYFGAHRHVLDNLDNVTKRPIGFTKMR